MKALDESLEELIASTPFLILQFGSASCPPCQAIELRLDAWLKGREDIQGRYVAIEEHREEAAQLGIFSSPTVMATREGRLLAKKSGYFSLDLLLEELERIWEICK